MVPADFPSTQSAGTKPFKKGVVTMNSYCADTPFSSPMEYTDIAREGSADSTISDVLKEGEITLCINSVEYAQISCTPLDIEELVIGKLFSDGVISKYEDITQFEYAENNMLINVRINTSANGLQEVCDVLPNESLQTDKESSLGPRIQKRDIELERYEAKPYNIQDVFYLYDDFASDTPLHSLTSGTHSCRVFFNGELRYVSEDIGRHNALDKAIGYLVRESIDPREVIIFSTGRVPSDMAKKAIHAKVAVLATKAAPTDKAIMLAKQYGLNLVCLVKSDHLRMYANG